MAGLSGDEWALVEVSVHRYQSAVRALGEISENRVTYYEDSPTKNPECQRRWKELNDAGVILSSIMVSLENKGSFPVCRSMGGRSGLAAL